MFPHSGATEGRPRCEVQGARCEENRIGLLAPRTSHLLPCYPPRKLRKVAPFIGIAAGVIAWQIAVSVTGSRLVPGPGAALSAIGELAQRGLLLRYVVASLFRGTWGY